jgi:hypothetical protein
MARVSKPMKLITLRIDEAEKARLEQLAERGDITLSRALREGAGLYLMELQAKAHRKRGGDTTFHGIRRDKAGRTMSEPSTPTATEIERLERLRAGLYDTGLVGLRQAWDNGVPPSIVLGGIAQWLSLVGRVYVSSGDETGWAWFLRDYCGYADEKAAKALCAAIGGGLIRPVDIDVSALLDRLETGFRRLIKDAEHQELVRRVVLPTWQVLEESV